MNIKNQVDTTYFAWNLFLNSKKQVDTIVTYPIYYGQFQIAWYDITHDKLGDTIRPIFSYILLANNKKNKLKWYIFP